jgi:hypothetical protein
LSCLTESSSKDEFFSKRKQIPITNFLSLKTYEAALRQTVSTKKKKKKKRRKKNSLSDEKKKIKRDSTLTLVYNIVKKLADTFDATQIAISAELENQLQTPAAV